jgi:NAD(P)-dependent dehydrogenase (short-subunit alcohol dehydrogenase family)
MENVIVTGASRGLGLGIARKLVGAGYRVVAVARRESEELACVIRHTEKAGKGWLVFESRAWSNGCARTLARYTGWSTTPASGPTVFWLPCAIAKFSAWYS